MTQKIVDHSNVSDLAWQIKAVLDAVAEILPLGNANDPVSIASLVDLGRERAGFLASALSEMPDSEVQHDAA